MSYNYLKLKEKALTIITICNDKDKNNCRKIKLIQVRRLSA